MRPAAPVLVRVLGALAVALLAAGPVAAEPPRVRIASAAVGLPPGGREDPNAAPVCKFAAWAPVYVELEILGEVKEPAQLVVETPDADGIITTLAVPLDLAAASPGTTLRPRDLRMMPYLRPAAGTGETTVTVRTAAGAALSEPFRIRSLRPRDPLTYVVLSLGSRLPEFDLPKPTGTGEAELPPGGPLRGGRVELTAIADFDLLPDQWFGYDAADLVILNTGTGSDDLVKRLFNPRIGGPRLQAFWEWIGRGGRLVVAVGGNAGLVKQLPALDFLPYTVNPNAPTRPVTRLPLYWAARESSQTSTLNGVLALKGGATFPLANLVPKPGHAGRVVSPPAGRQAEDREIVAAQAGYGLGRVTVIGFDLDRPPFTEFSRQAEFWDWVLREGGSSRASVGSEGKPRPPTAGPTDDENEVAVAVRAHLDTFDDVPVVSFGAVALLIVLYLLLIGPVEYYFLRRVLGRLELTWLSFPPIVLTVCVAAYLTAAAVKGRELRVNKVDVIDVVAGTDPLTGKPGGSVYGTTWCTVFSPRIDTYTIGVTPAEGWTRPGETGDSLVGWVGGPRTGRASLLRRRYGYHVGAESGVIADALENVPIQVWSTKSFAANWAGAIDPASPVVESRLEHPPGDPTRAVGTFVNRMPFAAVTDCVAFYAGQAYPLGTILSGQEVRLILDRGLPAAQWLQEHGQLAELLGRVQGSGAATAGRPGSAPATSAASGNRLPLWGLLFHEASLRNEEGAVPRNASFRRLDQSWRLAPDNRDEVIVVGRVLPPPGPAEALFGGPASPSRIWLKALPGHGDRPAVPGTGRQETYVRLYLPIK